MPKRAVFFDRDGTLNVDKDYLSDPTHLKIIPGTGPALQFDGRRVPAFVVTNQSGVGRGYYTLADMHAVNQRLCVNWARMASASKRYISRPRLPTNPAAVASPARNSCSMPGTNSVSIWRKAS
jgi:D-glycero-D-manno-heptose 1,7-bisphosphate phosphatase